MRSNLRAIRISLGMTQRELAAVFSQTAANISHYETGKQELPPACARALIVAARARGREVTFDEIYAVPKSGGGQSPLPFPDEAKAA
jgi:transcriptional regulator with XRE-family HTH domain